MTSTPIALIADCLRHPDTELLADPDTWKHADDSPVTDDEAEAIHAATLGDVRAALAIVTAEAEAAIARFN